MAVEHAESLLTMICCNYLDLVNFYRLRDAGSLPIATNAPMSHARKNRRWARVCHTPIALARCAFDIPMTVFTLLAIAAHTCSIASDAPGGPTVLAEFDIEAGGGPVFVPAKVNGKNYRLLLDTGSARTVFDFAHRGEFGPQHGDGLLVTPAGVKRVATFKAPSIGIGERLSCEHSGTVGCVDLKPLAGALGEKIDGVLGVDYLGILVFSIDFDLGKLAFYNGTSPAFGRRIPVRLGQRECSGCPFVDATVGVGGNSSASFLVDTGAIADAAGAIKSATFDRLVDKDHILLRGGTAGAAVTMERTIGVESGRITRLSVGGYSHDDLIFVRLPAESSLGLGYLSRFFVAFDLKDRAMYMRAGRGFARASRCVCDAGLTVARRGDVIEVLAVDDGGVAARGGVRDGDVISSIDGREARRMSLFLVRRILASEGTHLVELQRAGALRQARIVLQPTDITPAHQAGSPGDIKKHTPRAATPAKPR